MFCRPSLSARDLLPLAALSMAMLCVNEAKTAAAQNAAPAGCKQLISIFDGQANIGTHEGIIAALVETAAMEASATPFLPARTALIFCTLAENGVIAQMSRSDALWFQAGYGGMEPSDPKDAPLAFPKWSNENPSIFRVLPGQTGQPGQDTETPADRNGFSFQIGR